MDEFHRIIVGLDGSDESRRALRCAVSLARTHGATLHAVGVEERLPHYAATIGEVQEAKQLQDTVFSRVMEEVRRIAEEYGVEVTTEIRAGNAAQELLRAAREQEADLIVLGAKGHNVIRDFLLGSTTDRVTHHAPCSVLVVRDRSASADRPPARG